MSTQPSLLGHNGGEPIAEQGDTEERAGNWFAVSRDIFTHHVVGIRNRPYTDFEAWLSLIAMATYETKKETNKGTTIVLDPGDLMAAHAYLAQRWQWTVAKVRWFLNRLHTEAMIARHCANQDSRRNNNQIQVITICNYAKFQLVKSAEQQAKRQAGQQASDKPATSQQQESNNETINPEEDKPPRRGPSSLDALRAFEQYNAVALHLGLRQASKFTPERQKKITARLNVYGEDGWKHALGQIQKSSFLRGHNDRGWRADLDWMLQASSFGKLYDGVYEDKPAKQANGSYAGLSQEQRDRIERATAEARGGGHA